MLPVHHRLLLYQRYFLFAGERCRIGWSSGGCRIGGSLPVPSSAASAGQPDKVRRAYIGRMTGLRCEERNSNDSAARSFASSPPSTPITASFLIEASAAAISLRRSSSRTHSIHAAKLWDELSSSSLIACRMVARDLLVESRSSHSRPLPMPFALPYLH